jgi:hypothetical protein
MGVYLTTNGLKEIGAAKGGLETQGNIDVSVSLL